LATASHDEESVRIWDVESLKEIGEIKGDDIRVGTLAFSKDGTLIVGGGSQKLWAWNVEDRKVVFKTDHRNCNIYSVAISSDNKLLATGGGEKDADAPGKLRVWNTATGKLEHEFENKGGAIIWLAFGPRPNSILSGQYNGALALWDIQEKSVKQIDEPDGDIHVFSISQDGKSVAIGGSKGGIKILTIDGSKKPLKTKVDGKVKCLYLSNGMEFLATGFAGSKGIEVRDLGEKKD
jgi:WD40 repeat protein